MKRNAFLGTLGLVCALATTSASIAGTIDGSATISATANGPNFDYTINLTNTGGPGGDNIETFWYGWVPGEDFLPTSPLSVTPPTGWTANITHFPNSPDNGYAIQFVTSTNPLTPGNSLTFMFESSDTPAQLAGDSPFYPGTPVGTSFLYQGAPFQGDSLQFLVASVPEPSTLALGLIGIASLAVLRLRRKREA